MSSGNFWRKNRAFFKLAVISNLEYRINFLVDAIIQPCMSATVEVVLWMAIFRTSQTTSIAGFTQEYYIAYALWAIFMGRVSTSWMYEFRMISEIELGNINSLLVRPISFYEYYLSQLLGYKFITTMFSLLIPLAISLYLRFPMHYERLPICMLLVVYYLVLIHSLSFLISCSAFFLNKVGHLTATKNTILWMLTGELFPIDLMPDHLKEFVLSLPFCSGVYLPVAYLTGRIDFGVFTEGFRSITIALIVVNTTGYFLWKKGLKTYSGTGA